VNIAAGARLYVMERGREVRRGGAGGGPVHAPRRPRTGFKDTAGLVLSVSAPFPSQFQNPPLDAHFLPLHAHLFFDLQTSPLVVTPTGS